MGLSQEENIMTRYLRGIYMHTGIQYTCTYTHNIYICIHVYYITITPLFIWDLLRLLTTHVGTLEPWQPIATPSCSGKAKLMRLGDSLSGDLGLSQKKTDKCKLHIVRSPNKNLG